MRYAVHILALSLLILTGCAREDVDGTGNGVSLALSLKNVGQVPEVQTKMTATITQDGAGFRGIEQVYVIPFLTKDADLVIAGSNRLGSSNVRIQDPVIGQHGLVDNNRAHLYKLASIPLRTNRVLAYGKAFDDGSVSTREGKHKNGVLTPSGLDNPGTAGDISARLKVLRRAFCLSAAAGEILRLRLRLRSG